MRPCGLFVTRGKEPIAVIGELGPETVASLTEGVRWTAVDRVSEQIARHNCTADKLRKPLCRSDDQAGNER
jgi:hypothetical protein